ncbi:MAG: hypothetical protein V4850_31050 [Myxococcota bacterium]
MHQLADGIAGRGGRDAISTRLFFFTGPKLTGWSTMGSAGGGSLSVTLHDDADPWDL